MFSNKVAIETLIQSDTTATREEKERVLIALTGKSEPVEVKGRGVVSFEEAARLLGYSSKSAVYKALSCGRIRGMYKSDDGKRASGILISSIEAIVGKKLD